MSWLARSIANSLKLDDDDDPPNPNPTDSSPKFDHQSESSSPHGVKEDISELTKTLSRQFWGVASFLAPPPPPESPPPSPIPSSSSSSYRISFDYHGMLKRSKTCFEFSSSRFGGKYKGFWKVKLVITPEQLVEILSQDFETLDFVENMRAVANCGN